MAHEIERKFLLANQDWRALVTGSFVLKQGYLSTTPKSTVRLRVKSDKAMLTVKSKNTGIRRSEFEYEIPIRDAEEMLQLCQTPLIEKTRYTITIGKHIWEIDEFSGANSGLLVAEIELDAEEESFEKPAWVGEEVSTDARYCNSNLVAHPFTQW
ncbi:MAG: CYTH domain-containing protein [Bacteroidia bacterium]|jgi:adenylate cyclase|nr:CYTH domain-containing protein [Bacteroidia bacterium]